MEFKIKNDDTHDLMIKAESSRSSGPYCSFDIETIGNGSIARVTPGYQLEDGDSAVLFQAVVDGALPNLLRDFDFKRFAQIDKIEMYSEIF